MSKSKSNWRRYFFEFISIFLGVSLAFALNKWNENNNRYESSQKTLLEIRNGLALDKIDFQSNRKGHEHGVYACHYFREYLKGEEVNKDSVVIYFHALLRDYISIQNRSGYESLKVKGLELVKDDSLRLQIISLYDYYYEIIEKIEEEYAENQFHENYFSSINNLLADYMVFDDHGKLIHFKPPQYLSSQSKNLLLSYLWMIEKNRSFTKDNYVIVEAKVKQLIDHIDEAVE